MKWIEFGCDTLLLAETPETRQHFFLFFPDFLFLSLFGSPVPLDAKQNEGALFSRTDKNESILF